MKPFLSQSKILYEKIRSNFIWIGVFGIAMGALEAIVVVYLRQIYYPTGFEFPLKFIDPKMVMVEWLREIATILMLVAVGIITGKNRLEKFSYFLYAFAIWDIFYYLWLFILLGWPSSLFTWDILFLIPVTWIGPVLAPVICSFTMILLSVVFIFNKSAKSELKLKSVEWGLLFSGVILILYTFMSDFLGIIIQESKITGFSSLSENEHFMTTIQNFTPEYYNWIVFSMGEILILIAAMLIFRRGQKKYSGMDF
ncbi:MAG: hypothetical protein WAO52_06340 [Prolixibacteraceae bacterium]